MLLDLLEWIVDIFDDSEPGLLEQTGPAVDNLPDEASGTEPQFGMAMDGGIDRSSGEPLTFSTADHAGGDYIKPDGSAVPPSQVDPPKSQL
jgi:hypothetical protein